MAVTVHDLLVMSPSRARLTLAGDGAGSYTFDNAALRAAFPEGTPLGDLVRTPITASDAAAIVLMMGARGRIYFCGSDVPAIPASVVPAQAALAVTLVCTVPATTGSWDFYIEAVHTLAR